MKGVAGRDGRHDVSLNEFVREIVHVCVDRQEPNTGEKINSGLRHFRVPRCNLVQHDLTAAEFITSPMEIPPTARVRLTGCLECVPGGSRHVIAGDGPFNEYRVGHLARVTPNIESDPA